MKRILCLVLCAVMAFSFCACGKKGGEEAAAPAVKLEGSWVIEKADYEEAADQMVMAMISILKSRFAEGMEIEFKEDGKATIGEAEADYSMEGDLLTITWENNNNFIFKVSESDKKLNLVVDNVLNATIVKK